MCIWGNSFRFVSAYLAPPNPCRPYGLPGKPRLLDSHRLIGVRGNFPRVSWRLYSPFPIQLVDHAATIAEWAGRSIREELIHGVGNTSALSWMSVGHCRHGPSARIQVEIYHWVGAQRIRCPPFYLRPSRNISSDPSPRTSDSEISSCVTITHMTRIRLGTRWK